MEYDSDYGYNETGDPKSLGNWSQDYLNDLDTSQYDFPNTLWHIKPTQEIIIKTIAMLAVAIPGLYLNLVILIIIIRNKWLWSASNFLIGNLAFIDFLILLLSPWPMLIRDFHQNYVLTAFGCRFEGFMQGALLLANVGAVIMVAYDRLAAAALTSEARVTKSAAPKIIAATWFVALVLSTPWIAQSIYVERQWRNYLEKFCTEDPVMSGIYWHFVLLLLVWIPMGVMILTYGAIMWRLEWTARKLSSRGGGKVVKKAKGKAMRITACILLADIVCRLPYSLMVYWRERNDLQINSVEGYFEFIWFLSHYLMYFNCAINPLIYGFTNTRFRKAMDRTPGIACCKFGSWCCVCSTCKKKEIQIVDKNTEKIFVIESSPRPDKKLSRLIKNMLHINKDEMDLSVPKLDEVTTKPTKVTPLKPDYI